MDEGSIGEQRAVCPQLRRPMFAETLLERCPRLQGKIANRRHDRWRIDRGVALDGTEQLGSELVMPETIERDHAP
jgi:hypothetical protein